MKRTFGILLSLFGIVAANSQAASPTVLFNEIMFHPPGTNSQEQWFELYNPNSKSVTLTGWKITRGVDFTFPTVAIPANGYLVVAANKATFHASHPLVANYVGGWTGKLNHHLELSDSSGKVVNAVEFYSDGDWATRRMGPIVLNREGWEWYQPADGSGPSLELQNAVLPNTFAQNWTSSLTSGGTPGARNSVATNDVAPFIAEVANWPQIPKSADAVFVNARIVDEAIVTANVTLNWRIDGTTSFTQTQMADDGAHQDGTANDGVYGASIPAHADHTIIEFFITASDATGHVRKYPDFVPPTDSGRTANLLFQVDNAASSSTLPVYRIIMTEGERAYLFDLGKGCPDSDSDAEMNATWITRDGVLSGGTMTQVRYNIGIRNRGHGTRTSVPHNYHVNIPQDRLWKGQAGINLNSQFSFSQIIGSAVMRKAGVPMPDSRPVELRLNGTNLMANGVGNSFGYYAANEQYNNDFIKRTFPLDPDGNSYRGIRDQSLCVPSINGVADLTWHGASWNVAGYTNAYFKQNNLVENDYTDLLKLIAVLNLQQGTTSSTYVDDVQKVINVEEWMRYMAANTLLDNTETALANGIGDDYALYRGATDTRFQALPYDMDSVMGKGAASSSPRDGIFQMNALPAMDRFMKTPEFAPVYFKALQELGNSVFASSEIDPLVDHLIGGFVAPDAIANMKSFNASHVAYVLSQFPTSLSVTSSLSTVSGYLHTTSATTDLTGAANAIDTRRVVVNGQQANWVAWQGTWSLNGIALHPGLNRLAVRSLGTNDVEVAFTNVDIWFDDGTISTASGTLAANATWTAAGGPYHVTANLTVPSSVTLTIQPGASVYIAPGVSITVSGTGRILAEGTENQHIHIGRNPAVTGNWASLDFIGATQESKLAYVDFDSGGGTTIGGHDAQVHVNNSIVFIDHCTWPATPVVEYISFDASSFIVQNCIFPSYPPPSGPESLHGINGIPAGGHGIFRDNYFGHTWGFNDTIDFTGGNRPGPILQVIGNVFDGASDDCLDLDSTDAWIEGNVFLHVHRDPARTDDARDTGSAISGGVDAIGQNSDWTIINNVFYDVDHVFLNKGNSTTTGNGGGRVALLYNTVIHVAKENSGSPASEIAVFDWSDDGIALPDPGVGSGLYAAYNIIYDYPELNRNYDPAHQTIVMNNNFLAKPWAGAGSGNQNADPRLNVGALSGIPVANVTAAQAREAAKLLHGSPAIGAGFGGSNAGALQRHGIMISGEPIGTTASTTATLQVGPGGTFTWGTIAQQPYGWAHFKWKLDDGPWSSEIAVGNNPPFDNPATISVTGLSDGPHTVYVTGKNDAGYYQDDPFVYPATSATSAAVTASKTWIVDTSFVQTNVTVRLNEILAQSPNDLSNSPDLVELFNYGTNTVDLSGFHLTRKLSLPYAFTFRAGSQLAPGEFMILHADKNYVEEGVHLGFTLDADGDSVFLLDNTVKVLDSIQFGRQVAGYSIGRVANGAWTLCDLTFGTENVAATIGDPQQLRINEWLTDRQFAASDSFVELFNPSNLPVELSGLGLSDASGTLNRFVFPQLSFIEAGGFAAFTADGSGSPGHLNFKLASEVGLISLAQGNEIIDFVEYGPQQTDVSEGRTPNGGATIAFFDQPTPGASNPGANSGAVTNITRTITPVVPLASPWKYNQAGIDLGAAWRAVGYTEPNWLSGNALFYHGNGAAKMPIAVGTTLAFNNPIQWTYYFRKHFTYNEPTEGLTLNLTQIVDDGIVVYLNGSEIYRRNMGNGTIVYSTPAQTTVGDATEFKASDVPGSRVQQGDNVLAVEVHQQNQSSSDIAMALGVDVVSSITNIVDLGTASPPIVLNEVFAKNVTVRDPNGTTADWVEFYNPSTNRFDLGDVSVTDDVTTPRKWTFAANTFIEAGAHLLLYFDSESLVSTNNTGFNLNQEGGTIFVFDSPARGGSLLDSIRYGLQVVDLSLSRVPDGTGSWTLSAPTPEAANTAIALASPIGLRINEWMASASDGPDWFELFNSSNAPVALGDLYLTDNLTDRATFRVQPLSFIGSGDHAFAKFDADSAPELGANHVGFNLSAKGEEIGLFDANGYPIDSVVFGAQPANISQGRLPDGNSTIVSFAKTASPGESNYLPLGNVIINEVLSNPDDSNSQAVELLNVTAVDVDASGWFLSNSGSDLKRFRIPDGTVIPARGYVVFNSPLQLDSTNGDSVILSAIDATGALTGRRATVKFGAAEKGISFGAAHTSIGDQFVAMQTVTLAAQNSAPKVGPVVVSEIMNLPNTATGEDENLEFIELENILSVSQSLFDETHPTNTWGLRGAVRYQFPTNISLATGERVLVVGFDPSDSTLLASFKSRYAPPANVRIFGPWGGALGNTQETVRLIKPGTPVGNFFSEVDVDDVEYSSSAPWPIGNVGSDSFQRIASTAFGNGPD